jgi:hypothetical protein
LGIEDRLDDQLEDESKKDPCLSGADLVVLAQIVLKMKGVCEHAKAKRGSMVYVGGDSNDDAVAETEEPSWRADQAAEAPVEVVPAAAVPAAAVPAAAVPAAAVPAAVVGSSPLVVLPAAGSLQRRLDLRWVTRSTEEVAMKKFSEQTRMQCISLSITVLHNSYKVVNPLPVVKKPAGKPPGQRPPSAGGKSPALAPPPKTNAPPAGKLTAKNAAAKPAPKDPKRDAKAASERLNDLRAKMERLDSKMSRVARIGSAFSMKKKSKAKAKAAATPTVLGDAAPPGADGPGPASSPVVGGKKPEA